ncbi:predicted protein [Arabidopsis lyrata subsp. lyrata]|uniref:Predicted protein n=1 Tax=Arabidopsis lyrata subsp. lyrata TaxID=81972 RepID=D7KGV0_ARALL|nr:predicted protein [Arabidopsis lyrata subsp. lyrata]
MESVPHHVVERILERLPVNTLLRFKAVSKQWKSSIESTSLQGRQLMQRQQSCDPDVLIVSLRPQDVIDPYVESLTTLVLASSSSLKIPTSWENTLYLVSSASCDGLVCLYEAHESGVAYFKLKHPHFKLAFGKDTFSGTFKPVWLYNSSEISIQNATTCEVFDFSTNAWRYVTPSAPYRVLGLPDPVFLDGSLHWFTDCQETKILSMDLHTEAFQVISKAPFADHVVRPYDIVMCNLDNRLCVSEMKWPNQLIWSFNSPTRHGTNSVPLIFISLLMGLVATGMVVVRGNEVDKRFKHRDNEWDLKTWNCIQCPSMQRQILFFSSAYRDPVVQDTPGMRLLWLGLCSRHAYEPSFFRLVIFLVQKRKGKVLQD